MSPEDFKKISHPEQKILNCLVNCLRTDGRTSVNLELTPPEGGSAKNLKALVSLKVREAKHVP